MPKITEQKRQYNKKYRELNIEKIKENQKKYREENKEMLSKKRKKYYQENKEKEKKRAIEYNNKHKQQIQERRKYTPEIKKYNQAYRKTPQGKKCQRISEWKSRGIIADNFDEWYEKYINCHECNFCHKEFTSTKDRHLDHNHSVNHCENIRGILCCRCNTQDVFLDILI